MAKTTQAANAKPAKKESPLKADKSGKFPYLIYSVRSKSWETPARKPIGELKSTGRGAYVCAAQNGDGEKITMIVGAACAKSWVDQKFAKFVEEED